MKNIKRFHTTKEIKLNIIRFFEKNLTRILEIQFLPLIIHQVKFELILIHHEFIHVTLFFFCCIVIDFTSCRCTFLYCFVFVPRKSIIRLLVEVAYGLMFEYLCTM